MQNITTIIGILCFLLSSCSKEDRTAKGQPKTDQATLASEQVWRELSQLANVENPTLASLDTIVQSTQASHTQKIYAKALKELATGNAKEASNLFLTIEPYELPPGFLYPPYRAIHTTKPPETLNPFRKPLLTLAEKGKLPSIWKARLFHDEGRFLESLTAFWQSSAADWTILDVDYLDQISKLQGAKPDVTSLVRKAITTQQLPPKIKSALEQQILKKENSFPNESMDQAIKQIQYEIDNKTGTGGMIIESLKMAFDLRRLFLEKDYKSVIEVTKDKDPIHQSDETLLITFLSATQLKDLDVTIRWGQEIERRNKDPETIKWVANIIQETRLAVQK